MEQIHNIWNEFYRPSNLENLIIEDEKKQKFQEYLDKQTIPHLGLFGDTGSGKTTLSKILVKNIECDFLYLNATENRSMDDIKEKVGRFAAASSFKPLKIIILDEATHLLEASQVLLLNMMETFSLKTRFILTGNYPERIIEPLMGRLQSFELHPPSKKEVAIHLTNILDKEEVTYELSSVGKIINQHYPDIRSIINSAQKYTVNKILQNNISSSDKKYGEKLLGELKKNGSIISLRQTIVDANLGNYGEVYNFLYKNVEKYAPKNIGEVIITIEEYKFRSISRVDQEITIVSCLAKILEILK